MPHRMELVASRRKGAVGSHSIGKAGPTSLRKGTNARLKVVSVKATIVTEFTCLVDVTLKKFTVVVVLSVSPRAVVVIVAVVVC